jgi:hypothetical protein
LIIILCNPVQLSTGTATCHQAVFARADRCWAPVKARQTGSTKTNIVWTEPGLACQQAYNVGLTNLLAKIFKKIWDCLNFLPKENDITSRRLAYQAVLLLIYPAMSKIP